MPEPTPASEHLRCRFKGTAASIHIRGDHGVVLLEQQRFQEPEARLVELSAVTLEGESMPDGLSIERPDGLLPLNMNGNGHPYEVWYRSGPDAGPLTVEFKTKHAQGSVFG